MVDRIIGRMWVLGRPGAKTIMLGGLLKPEGWFDKSSSDENGGREEIPGARMLIQGCFLHLVAKTSGARMLVLKGSLEPNVDAGEALGARMEVLWQLILSTVDRTSWFCLR